MENNNKCPPSGQFFLIDCAFCRVWAELFPLVDMVVGALQYLSRMVMEIGH